MPTSPNQKLKLLYLMDILLERTDEENTLTVQQMLDVLAAQGISAERKSIYSDLELLRRYGLDIETRRGKSFGYYVASRQFELPELKLLVDAVQSSRLITAKKSSELIKKIASLASSAEARQLRRQVFVAERAKTVNENVYYNVDAIHAAISQKKKVCFRYFDFNTAKKRVYRKDGGEYCQTPLALCWVDDNYYLVTYYSKYDALGHYRVDRMSDVRVSEEKADKLTDGRFNVAEHAKQVFGMFSGEMVNATLRFDNSLVNVVLDRFGKDVSIQPKGESFEIHVNVSENPVFLAWMFTFGGKAEIVAPEGLRNAMQELMEQSAGLYQNGK